ncbi:MAG: hypothetical protein ACKOCC_05025, partial [Actinomycetota bacterium]
MTPAAERLDARIDALLEPARRSRAVRALFGAASTVGDFSIIWHVIGFVPRGRGRAPKPSPG